MLFYVVPALFVIGVLGALATFPWRRAGERRRLWLLAFLSMPPVAAFLWGEAFRVEPGSLSHPVASWRPGFLWLALLVSVTLPIPFTYRMAGARLFTLSVSLAMAAATVVAGFLALMSVTGDYI